MKTNTLREPYLWEIALIIGILIAVLCFCLVVLEVEAHIPFIIVIALTSLIAVRLGHSWNDIENAVLKSISSAMQAILILLMVGMVIGSWIAGGIVPSLIYYGLNIINPQYFLITIFVVCSLCSIATRTSWTVVDTLGVAALGIGDGLGVPSAITAGVVVGAAYFGDKFSPLSDTPNLHCAICRVNIFDNFKNVLKTTIPSYLVAFCLCAYIGFKYANTSDSDLEAVLLTTQTLQDTFTIHPLLILPLFIVFVMIAFKTPAIPGIFVMVLVGTLCAVFVQDVSLSSIIKCIHEGYVLQTNIAVVNSLKQRRSKFHAKHCFFDYMCDCVWRGFGAYRNFASAYKISA